MELLTIIRDDHKIVLEFIQHTVLEHRAWSYPNSEKLGLTAGFISPVEFKQTGRFAGDRS